MGCPKLKYNLSPEPRLRCVYNAADGENDRIIPIAVRLTPNYLIFSSHFCVTFSCNIMGLSYLNRKFRFRSNH